MPQSAIHVSNKGLKEMEEALLLIEQPSFLVTGHLEEILSEAFDLTQTNVHVISGRLKASGRTASDYQDSVWSGTIEYGGDGSPAYYAIYEQRRHGIREDVGTPHDFFAGLEGLDGRFEDAIDQHFKGVL